MQVLAVLFALAGHAFLWIGLVNRLHAVGIRRWIIKLLTVGFFLCAAFIPLGAGWWRVTYYERSTTASWRLASDGAGVFITAYAVACWAIALVTLLRLVCLRCLRRPPPVLRFHGRRRANIDPTSATTNAGELDNHFLARLPWNEILQLEVTQWVFDVPRMAPALDGLSIVHLSDLHITGRVGKAFFREAVRVCNELQPDLVCITGDIMDRPIGFDWIADTLGRLVARHGAYFILGNHDRRVDASRLRRTMEESGLVDVAGRWLPIEIRGTPIVLGGNERPWFDGPVGCVKRTVKASPCNGAFHAPYDPLRIVLAHTPDQFAWARNQGADLLLTGHTHGGQICIPPLGAIFSPTRHGVKYISGIFYAPPTILHVTRGLSGDIPVRWNCRPEIAHLTLRAARAAT